MEESELNFYQTIGDWDFSQIKYSTEKITNWNFYKIIEENTNEKSICLDLGTGGGENILKNYPEVGMIIATDFSDEMIKTAKENLKRYPTKNVKFIKMDNLNMKVPNDLFNLVSARHTVIDAKQIYDCLTENGIVVIEGVDKKDCWDLKRIFKRGQAYNDEFSISEQDYKGLEKAGFKQIKRVEILENEYYETEADLMALLQKTPIINDFSKIHSNNSIELDLFNEYVKKYKSEKGILLKRVLYGIVAKK